MRKKVRFPNRVYIILLLVLVIGLLLQISRTQFLLQFQQNHDLLAQRDRLFSEPVTKQEVETTGKDYCVATSELNEYSRKLKINAFKTLDYMKKQTREIHLEDLELKTENCVVIIFAADSLEQIANIQVIGEFVSNGGYVFFMSTLENEKNFQALARMSTKMHRMHIKFYFIVGPYRQPLLDKHEDLRMTMEDFIVKTNKIITANSGFFLNLHPQLNLSDYYFVDRFHLNEHGSALTAKAIGKFIDKSE